MVYTHLHKFLQRQAGESWEYLNKARSIVYRKRIVEKGTATRGFQAADFEFNFEGCTFSATSTETGTHDYKER